MQGEPEQPQREPELSPAAELALDPLEVHIAQLRAELERTRLVLALSAAAALLAALACLYAARGGAVRLPAPAVAP